MENGIDTSVCFAIDNFLSGKTNKFYNLKPFVDKIISIKGRSMGQGMMLDYHHGVMTLDIAKPRPETDTAVHNCQLRLTKENVDMKCYNIPNNSFSGKVKIDYDKIFGNMYPRERLDILVSHLQKSIPLLEEKEQQMLPPQAGIVR